MNDIGSVPHAGVWLICIHNYHVLFSDEQSSGGGSNVSQRRNDVKMTSKQCFIK